jgi:hypothetical protein
MSQAGEWKRDPYLGECDDSLPIIASYGARSGRGRADRCARLVDLLSWWMELGILQRAMGAHRLHAILSLTLLGAWSAGAFLPGKQAAYRHT